MRWNQMPGNKSLVADKTNRNKLFITELLHFLFRLTKRTLYFHAQWQFLHSFNLITATTIASSTGIASHLSPNPSHPITSTHLCTRSTAHLHWGLARRRACRRPCLRCSTPSRRCSTRSTLPCSPSRWASLRTCHFAPWPTSTCHLKHQRRVNANTSDKLLLQLGFRRVPFMGRFGSHGELCDVVMIVTSGFVEDVLSWIENHGNSSSRQTTWIRSNYRFASTGCKKLKKNVSSNYTSMCPINKSDPDF